MIEGSTAVKVTKVFAAMAMLLMAGCGSVSTGMDGGTGMDAGSGCRLPNGEICPLGGSCQVYRCGPPCVCTQNGELSCPRANCIDEDAG